jgi:hypothetical protein
VGHVQLHTPPSSTETVYSTPGLEWLGTLQLLKTLPTQILGS